MTPYLFRLLKVQLAVLSNETILKQTAGKPSNWRKGVSTHEMENDSPTSTQFHLSPVHLN